MRNEEGKGEWGKCASERRNERWRSRREDRWSEERERKAGM